MAPTAKISGPGAGSRPAPEPDGGRRQPAVCQPQCTFGRVEKDERPEAEQFIRNGFERAYRARLRHFMPALMSLRRHSKMAAACGLRAAAAERLFLECYLERPVEVALSEAAKRPVSRGDIVEVGNLVVARAGFARNLILHLTAYLHASGAAWVVFTAVPSLRNNFIRLGIPLVALAAADAARLDPAALADWGTYYEQGPVITAVNVAAAFAAVRELSCTR